MVRLPPPAPKRFNIHMTEAHTAAVPADGEPRAAAAPNPAAAAPTEPQTQTPGDPLRHNRGNRSTIADLPNTVRADICREIRAGTPDNAIAENLRARGYPVSRSAIYRFRKAAADSLAQWSEIRDAAALWSEGGTHEALAEMLRVAAFAIAARIDPAAPDAADNTRGIARMVRAIRDLAAAEAAQKTAAAQAGPRRGAPGSIDDPRLPSLPPPNTWDADAQAAANPGPPKPPRRPWTDRDWLEYDRHIQEGERKAREAERERREAEREYEPAHAPETAERPAAERPRAPRSPAMPRNAAEDANCPEPRASRPHVPAERDAGGEGANCLGARASRPHVSAERDAGKESANCLGARASRPHVPARCDVGREGANCPGPRASRPHVPAERDAGGEGAPARPGPGGSPQCPATAPRNRRARPPRDRRSPAHRRPARPERAKRQLC